MRYFITKEVEISASHQLDLPPEHKCSRNHGHNYKIVVTLSAAKLDKQGFVIDFGIVKALIDSHFDHRFLNEAFTPTTVENFCGVLWDLLERLVILPCEDPELRVEEITIHETATCKATLRR